MPPVGAIAEIHECVMLLQCVGGINLRLFGFLLKVTATMLAGDIEEIGERSIRDQVVPVLVLLQSTEGHLGTWNVFLWILEVFELLSS